MGSGLRLALRVLGAALLVGLFSVGVATAGGSSQTGGRVLGRLAVMTPLHVTVALRPRDPAALTAYAREVSTPGSSVYRRFLGPSQFGRRFGADQTAIATVRRALSARGLHPGPVSRDRLSLSFTAPAGAVERGLRLTLDRVALSGHRTAVAASGPASLGRQASSAVQAVIGLGSRAAPQPLLVRPAPGEVHRTREDQRHASTGGPQACQPARSAAAAEGAFTSDQIASSYGFSALYAAGDKGAGVTAAVYELEPVSRSDLATYQACYHTNTSISFVPVDGGAGSGQGSGEAALDIENLLSYAPEARLLVYQGPNSNSGSPGAGPYDIFRAIVDQDRAQVASISWGECESALGPSDAEAENVLFEQAAVQGQTIISAAGDSGSEDCQGSSPFAQSQLAVDDPASQPFVTGIGGTRLNSLGPRPAESVWNSGGQGFGQGSPGAAGGGFSALWGMPPGQRDAAASLNVLGAGSTGSRCGHPGGYCREVPDVAGDADPATGYEIYWNGSWQTIGGTSAAAPVWAALMALTDASRGCRAGPVGYVLPALYRAAAADYAGTFNDVRTGNNDYTGTNGGQFAAAAGYDEASGLGSPNAASLAPALCSLALRISPPRTQHSARQASVSLRLHPVDAPGAKVSLRVSGLPRGLRFRSASDQVTGRPRRAGRYRVTVLASDAQNSKAQTSFSWQIGAPVRLASAVLSGLSRGRPVLSFAVVAGRGSPALRQLAIVLPSELRFRSAAGVTLRSGRKHLRFRRQLRGGRLVLSLRRTWARVTVRLAAAGLRLGPGRGSRLSVTVLDAGGGTSSLRTRVRRG